MLLAGALAFAGCADSDFTAEPAPDRDSTCHPLALRTDLPWHGTTARP
jgi:hypothetical protein